MDQFLQKIIKKLQDILFKLRHQASNKKVIHTEINGYELLVLANEDVGRQICLRRFETAETKYLYKMIRSDAICIDIGANVGYFTLLMAQLASSGSVHAFEPIPLNATLLKASSQLNGFTNICINQWAVGDTVGEVPFSLSSDSAYSSIKDTGRKPLIDTLNVFVTTIDEYLSLKGIDRVDIIKADVEGAEGLVISGASELLSDENRRPSIVVLELYDQNLYVFGESVELIVTKMLNFGYKPFVINNEGNLLKYNEEFKSSYHNVFFFPF